MKWLIRHRAPVNLLIDLVAFQIALIVAYSLRFETGVFTNPLRIETKVLLLDAIVLTLFWLAIFAAKGMYRHQLSTSRYEAFAATAQCGFIGLLILFVIFFFADLSQPVSPSKIILITYVVLVAVLSGAGRALFRTLIRSCFRKGIGKYRAVVVGCGKRGRKLLRTLNNTPEFGYEVVGVAVAGDQEKPPEGIRSFPLSELEQVLDPASGENVEFVLLSLEPSNRKKVLDIIDRSTRFPVRVMIIPDFFQILVGLARSHQLYGVPLMEVFPDLLDPFSRVVKRLMDITVSLLVLTVGLPVMLVLAVLIKLDSKGPVIYKQKRVGYKGREFTLYKFRSMVHGAEQKTGAIWAKTKDPRITRIGRFMRDTRLDELPQAWNVLKGNMSLVGPRPERKVFVDEFIQKIPFYNRRHNVKPGITGWAQIRHGYDASIDDVREKLQYDLFYLENISLGLDIRIFVNTLWVMITMKGH